MADTSTAIAAMIVLLVTSSVGFLATKLGYFDEHVYSKLSRLLLNITLPCTIIASVTELDREAGQQLMTGSFVYGALLYIGLLILSWVCNIALRVPREEWGEYLFMGTLTNLAFIGIPVGTALFGPQAAFTAAIFILVTNVLIYSIGVIICTSVAGRSSSIDFRAMLSGPMVASLIAVVLFALNAPIPGVISSTLGFIGDMTAPLAMMMVGYIVTTSDLRTMLGEWRIYCVSVLRQLVVPAIMWLAFRGMVPNPMLLGTFCVMFAMPVGVVVPIIAGNYGFDEQVSAKGTIISTVLSFATIPLLVTIMTAL